MDNQIEETVYGTAQDDSHVMSERVQALAASIYKEFERMIQIYDENVVKELMPLVVGILENLDQSCQEKQENDVELELLRDDNEQLLTQYDREKQLRKGAEQKYLEFEDSNDVEKRELQSKVESLETSVRMFELKAKNAQDHVTRLDEKESEMKKEYSKLHDRYTELFRTHMDYMERTKLFMGGDKILESGVSPRGRGGFQMPVLRPVGMNVIYDGVQSPTKTGSSPPSYNAGSPSRALEGHSSLRSELRDMEKGEAENCKASKEMRNKSIDTGTKTETSEKEQVTDSIQVHERSTGTKSDTKETSVEGKDTSTKTSESDSALLFVDDITNRTPSSDTIPTSSSPKPPSKSSGSVRDSDALSNSQDASDEGSSTLVEARVRDADITRDYSLIGREELADIISNSEPGDTMMSPELDDLGTSLSDQAHSSPVRIAGASRKNESSLFDELSSRDSEALGDIDDGCDITDANDSEDKLSSVSDNFFGMSKEVENLILENTELLATKNALNVVKDDLIAKVDELSRARFTEESEEYIPVVLRSEQEILREEISSLQTAKEKLKKRVTELEEEVKKAREELEKEKTKKSAEGGEDEGDVPMAQRKRFTRVEMARVLMERNQYKERLMELQEAVRWTEMIRASREHPELAQEPKKKGSIWNFFSNLFSPLDKPKRKKMTPLPSTSVRYNAPTTNIRPEGDPNKKQRDKYVMGEKTKAYDFLTDDALAEKARKEREKERREQYKQVRAHVKKDDGRMQAYGWSLPAKYQPPTPKEASTPKSHVPVPVPVYCRPLQEEDTGMKLWCAAGVNLSGGRTKDGGSVVGASVFYSDPPPEETQRVATNDVEKLDLELQDHEKGLKALANEQLSSLVWICTTQHNNSEVTVVDSNNPGDILSSFRVTSSHVLCIASVSGAMESDYPSDEKDVVYDADTHPLASDAQSAGASAVTSEVGDAIGAGIGGVTLVQCATGAASHEGTPTDAPPSGESGAATSQAESNSSDTPTGAPENEEVPAGSESECDVTDTTPDDGAGAQNGETSDKASGSDGSGARVTRATGSPASSASNTPVHVAREGKRLLKEPSELVKDGISDVTAENDVISEEVEKMSSVQPTMWMGSQSGSLYVHSAVSQWKRCLHSVKLKDSILAIVHVKGRVFVALADGSVAVFRRAADGQWDLTNYHVVDLGKPHHSIRCLCVVGNKHVWCGYRNKVHVMDPKSLRLEKTFDAHPRKESQVRQLAWVGDGVWVSIRLDSTLRLYHAYTHQHLQDVDIEPYVSKMLGTGKLGFSFVRITSLLVSCNRLWIGTGNGVIISVPLSEGNRQAVTTSTAGRPGGVIRVYSDVRTDTVTPGSFIPYCSMAQAQLSFHGHRDSVKFFVAVPGATSKGVSGVMTSAVDDGVSEGGATVDKDNKDASGEGDVIVRKKKKTMLVMSGGEGYIDFRLGDTDEEGESAEGEEKKTQTTLSKGDKSHLIVWHLSGYW